MTESKSKSERKNSDKQQAAETKPIVDPKKQKAIESQKREIVVDSEVNSD